MSAECGMTSFPDEIFLFFGCHFHPFFADRIAMTVQPMHTAFAESAEKNTYKSQQAQRLPEINACPTRNGRHKPVPQPHHNDAQAGDNSQSQQYMRKFEKMYFHIKCFISYLCRQVKEKNILQIRKKNIPLIWLFPDNLQGKFFQGRKIFGRIVLSCTTTVFSESNIQMPVQMIFNSDYRFLFLGTRNKQHVTVRFHVAKEIFSFVDLTP
jgi:hypothetical protein